VIHVPSVFYHIINDIHAPNNISFPPSLPLTFVFYHLQIGIITSLTPFVAFVSAPLAAWIVDMTKKPVFVLSSISVLAAGTYWLFALPNLGFLGACAIAMLQSFFAAPIFPLMDALVLDMLGEEPEKYVVVGFMVFFFCTFESYVGANVGANVTTLCVCLIWLGTANNGSTPPFPAV
jgi:MFS family permease